MEIDIKYFKEKLNEEKIVLEGELEGVGRVNPKNSEDWEATPVDFNTGNADKNEVADKMEEYETRTAVELELEIRLSNIKKAIDRIDAGNYGLCKVDGGQIEIERLAANPSAQTCKAHINE